MRGLLIPTSQFALLAAVVLAVLKLVDYAFGIVLLLRRPTHPGEPPAFLWASGRGRFTMLVVNTAFRAPTVVIIVASATLWVACERPNDFGAKLAVCGGLLSTAIAVLILVFSLLVEIMKRRGMRDGARFAGWHLQRATRTGRDDRVPISTLLFIPMVTVSLLTGYAALYRALTTVDPHAFHSEVPFGTVHALYFSLITGATVGYGDVYPQTPAAEIAVMSQIAASVTGLSLLFFALSPADRAPVESENGHRSWERVRRRRF